MLRGVWREVIGAEPEAVPAYIADWSETGQVERLWDAAARNLKAVPVDMMSAGQIVLFRMRDRNVAKHLGILAGNGAGFATVIHAYTGRGVIETPLTDAWTRKVVAQFQFPQRNI